ncbi:MAG: hypothetical protein WCO63_15975 [Bacteroidota bacterium]
MVRVLKPGGKIATSVWNAPGKNFWVTAIMETISRNIELTSPLPGSPGMFRCAKDGFISDIFIQAGLKNITQKEIAGKMNFKTIDVYWSMMTEVVSLVVAALSKADDKLKNKIMKEVYHALNQKYSDGDILLDSSAFVIYGEK